MSLLEVGAGKPELRCFVSNNGLMLLSSNKWVQFEHKGILQKNPLQYRNENSINA